MVERSTRRVYHRRQKTFAQFCFLAVKSALACAVELQKLFSAYSGRHGEQQLRVRIGLHTGNVFREQDDFLGRTVIVAARITGRARGGEVLVSQAVKEYTERAGRWDFGPPSNLGLALAG